MIEQPLRLVVVKTALEIGEAIANLIVQQVSSTSQALNLLKIDLVFVLLWMCTSLLEMKASGPESALWSP